MNTQAQQIDTKQSLTDETLKTISLEHVDSNTYGIYTNDDEFVCSVMWDDGNIWVKDSEYNLTKEQAQTITSKVEDVLFEEEQEEKSKQEVNSDFNGCYYDYYGVRESMFI